MQKQYSAAQSVLPRRLGQSICDAIELERVACAGNLRPVGQLDSHGYLIARNYRACFRVDRFVPYIKDSPDLYGAAPVWGVSNAIAKNADTLTEGTRR